MAHPFDRLDNEAAAAEERDIRRRQRRRVDASKAKSFFQALLMFAVAMLTILVVYALLNDVSHFKAIHTMMNMLNVSSSSHENKSIVTYCEHFSFSIKGGADHEGGI